MTFESGSLKGPDHDLIEVHGGADHLRRTALACVDLAIAW
jgi:hypothetical protein